MLRVEKLTLSYWDKTPVQNVSFSLGKGDIGCIIGLSGVGKTTLAKALAGILKPAGGSIYLDNLPLSPSTHKIGYVAQDYSLYPWKTVLENITLAVRIKKQTENPSLLREICLALGIEEILQKYPAALSGGQKQRVALARGFLLSPDLLIMDEPFSALDEITRAEAKALFQSVWSKYKPTTLLITHSIEEAMSLGHRLFIQRVDFLDTVCLDGSCDKEQLRSEIVNKLEVART